MSRDGVFFQRRRAPGTAGRRRPESRVSDASLSAQASGHGRLRRPGLRERLLPAGRGAEPAAGGGPVCRLSALHIRQQQGQLAVDHFYQFISTLELFYTFLSIKTCIIVNYLTTSNSFGNHFCQCSVTIAAAVLLH